MRDLGEGNRFQLTKVSLSEEIARARIYIRVTAETHLRTLRPFLLFTLHVIFIGNEWWLLKS